MGREREEGGGERGENRQKGGGGKRWNGKRWGAAHASYRKAIM